MPDKLFQSVFGYRGGSQLATASKNDIQVIVRHDDNYLAIVLQVRFTTVLLDNKQIVANNNNQDATAIVKYVADPLLVQRKLFTILATVFSK
eukprot:m.43478 g.43478  ORF g.43478 m.43478 type:complete len:92 (+) comp9978_c0_seq1:859-1134(+)